MSLIGNIIKGLGKVADVIIPGPDIISPIVDVLIPGGGSRQTYQPPIPIAPTTGSTLSEGALMQMFQSALATLRAGGSIPENIKSLVRATAANPVVSPSLRSLATLVLGFLGAPGANVPAPPPNLPAPPGQPSAGSVLQTADVFGPAVITPQLRTVVAATPGRVTVTMPFAAAGFAAGSKVQMRKDLARALKLWKPPRKPVLTYSDMKTLKTAERVERKLVGLTRRHTDFKVTSKIAAARASARATTTRKR